MLRNRIFIVLLSLALAAPAALAASGRKITHRTMPAYPSTARQFHIAGVVKLEVTVSADGNVEHAKVVAGHPMLTQAAVSAVTQWKYEPGQESVESVEVSFNNN